MCWSTPPTHAHIPASSCQCSRAIRSAARMRKNCCAASVFSGFLSIVLTTIAPCRPDCSAKCTPCEDNGSTLKHGIPKPDVVIADGILGVMTGGIACLRSGILPSQLLRLQGAELLEQARSISLACRHSCSLQGGGDRRKPRRPLDRGRSGRTKARHPPRPRSTRRTRPSPRAPSAHGPIPATDHP